MRSTKEKPTPFDPVAFQEGHLTKILLHEPRDTGENAYYGVIPTSPNRKQPNCPLRGRWVDQL